MPALNNRPTAHYPGDVTASVGQVVGPNTAGEYLVIDEVTYDPGLDRSTARFRYAATGDLTAQGGAR